MFFIFWAPTILHPPLLLNFWSSTHCVAVWPEPAVFFNQASTPSGGIVKQHRHKIYDPWQVLAARCDEAMMVLNL